MAALHRVKQGSFNSRSRMGSDRQMTLFSTPKPGFNSRSRMGSDLLPGTGLAQVVLVSIHAPAWGATAIDLVVAGRRGVSIHAPAWGATLLLARRLAQREFQFTLPHGERLGRSNGFTF